MNLNFKIFFIKALAAAYPKWKKQDDKNKAIVLRRKQNDPEGYQRYVKSNREYAKQRQRAIKEGTWVSRPKAVKAKPKYRHRRSDESEAAFRSYQRENKNKWRAERKRSNLQFLLSTRLRRQVATSLSRCKKGLRKADSIIGLLGCKYCEFMKHIICQFKDGMTVEKLMRGEIHLDHKRPVSSFDLTRPEEQKKAFHYTNYQPLWKSDNLKKWNKLLPEYL